MSGNNKPATKKSKSSQTGWAQAIRDMVVASIDRGQLPIFGLFMVMLIFAWRMPADDLSRLIFEILGMIKEGDIYGWASCSIALLGWFMHAKHMRSEFFKEAERIGKEKSALQSKVAGVAFQSSEQK